MEAGTAERPSERKPSDALPAGAPTGLVKATDGEETTGAEEAGALDFILGAPQALVYTVKAQIDTPKGRRTATFHLRQIDGDAIIKMEDEAKENPAAVGPFAELDDVRLNAAIVTAATVKIEEPGGRSTTPDSPEFVGSYIDPKIAMEKRFGFQSGVLASLAAQVRRISGFEPGRVANAEQAIRDAAGSS